MWVTTSFVQTVDVKVFLTAITSEWSVFIVTLGGETNHAIGINNHTHKSLQQTSLYQYNLGKSAPEKQASNYIKHSLL